MCNVAPLTDEDREIWKRLCGGAGIRQQVAQSVRSAMTLDDSTRIHDEETCKLIERARDKHKKHLRNLYGVNHDEQS